MNWLAEGARGRFAEFNEALAEEGKVRCQCGNVCDPAELDNGLCSECRPQELTTAEVLGEAR